MIQSWILWRFLLQLQDHSVNKEQEDRVVRRVIAKEGFS